MGITTNRGHTMGFALAAMLPFGPALAGGPGIEVEGQDDAYCETPYYVDGGGDTLLANPGNVIDCDVERIQAAVDTVPAGDTVKLRGTFNLGTELPFINEGGHPTWQSGAPNPDFWAHPRATVFVTRDVALRGMDGATIVGGYPALAVGLAPRAFQYETYDPDFWYIGGVASFVSVQISVNDLSFVNPAFAGVAVFATTGAEIVSNRFEGMQLVPSHIFVPYAPAIFIDGGIAAAANYPNFFDDYFYQPGDWISGDIRITGNHVLGSWGVDPNGVENPNYGGLPMNSCNTGIHVWYTHAEVAVKDNTIERCWEGIRSTQNWGTTTIRDNVVVQPDDFPGTAIAANSSAIFTGQPFPYFEAGRSIIASNAVELRPGGIGIVVSFQDAALVTDNSVSGPGLAGIAHWFGFGATIRDNEIHMEGVPWGAISLEDFAFTARVAGNTISGSGRAAIRMGWPFAPTEFNVISDNDMRGFSPQASFDFFGITEIGSHIELLWGASENVIENNQYATVGAGDPRVQNVYFTGAIPPFGLPGATGNTLREGQALRVMDFTDPAGPLYNAATYAGANEITLGD